MARKNYTAEQIIGMLREAEVRIPGINRTVFRSKIGRHSDMKPDAIPINNRTV